MITYLQNSDGELSSTRLLMMLVNVSILGVWVFGSVMSTKDGGQMLPLPQEVLALSGLTIMGKVANSALAEKGSTNAS